MLTESFFGREDIKLTDRLSAELPGILNWSIAGWLRLRERGHFVQPKSGVEAIEQLEDLGSPISAFIRDKCMVGPQHSTPRDDLFAAWCGWCELQGYKYPGTRETFGRDLRAAVPNIKDERRRVKGVQKRFYKGIGLVYGPASLLKISHSASVPVTHQDRARQTGATSDVK